MFPATPTVVSIYQHRRNVRFFLVFVSDAEKEENEEQDDIDAYVLLWTTIEEERRPAQLLSPPRRLLPTPFSEFFLSFLLILAVF